MRGFAFTAVLSLASISVARADTVVLQDGATYDGRVRITDDGVQVELDFGTVTFDRSMVKRIVRSRSRLDVFEAKLARAEGDVEALLRVARWAESHGLERRARDVYRAVIRLDPDHAAARSALGHVQVGGRWLESDEAKRAAGLQRYGGVWLSAEQVRAREAAARERRLRLVERRAARAEAAAEAARADAEAARAAAARSPSVPVGGWWWAPVPWRPHSGLGFGPGRGPHAGRYPVARPGPGPGPQPGMSPPRPAPPSRPAPVSRSAAVASPP